MASVDERGLFERVDAANVLETQSGELRIHESTHGRRRRLFSCRPEGVRDECAAASDCAGLHYCGCVATDFLTNVSAAIMRSHSSEYSYSSEKKVVPTAALRLRWPIWSR
jgi:hypothetical protein